jgi:hypothetical protein
MVHVPSDGDGSRQGQEIGAMVQYDRGTLLPLSARVVS